MALNSNYLVREARKSGPGYNGFLECLIFIALFVVSSIFLVAFSIYIRWMMGEGPGMMAVLEGVTNEVADPGTAGLSTAITLISQIYGYIPVFFYCTVLEGRSYTSMGFVKEGFTKRYGRGLLVGLVMFGLTVVGGMYFGGFRFQGVTENFQPLMLLLLLVGFGVQGMYEELLCRGYLMMSLARRYHPAVGVLVSALIFMLLHGFNPGFGPLPALNLFLFGVFMSVYMLKTENIWGVGAIHSIWNFAQGCIFGFNVSGSALLPTILKFETTENTLIGGGAFGPEGGLPVTAVVVVFTILVLLLGQGNERWERNAD